jgi:hypothetical protein
MLEQPPGLEGACFVALDGDQGPAVQVFDAEEQARASAPPERTTAPGVTLSRVEFGRVIGSA